MMEEDATTVCGGPTSSPWEPSRLSLGQADTDLYTVIELFKIPMINTNQRIDWYLYNVATGQTIGVSWQLWITPVTQGPHA